LGQEVLTGSGLRFAHIGLDQCEKLPQLKFRYADIQCQSHVGAREALYPTHTDKGSDRRYFPILIAEHSTAEDIGKQVFF
jgi:hypothetical protein